jgi:hypothetical protein
MNHPEKILKITLLTNLRRRVLSIYQSSTSRPATVFHAPSMQELSELDPKLEVIEIPDTPLSSETSKTRVLRLVDLPSQPHQVSHNRDNNKTQTTES